MATVSPVPTSVKVKVSTMSGKLGRVPAINTNTLTNPFCQRMQRCPGSICAQCYSQSMLSGYRRNCAPAFERNSNRLSESDLSESQLPRIRRNDIARFHAHGELINLRHMVNLLRIARKNPRVTFGFWTKRRDIVGRFFRSGRTLPANVVLIYSNPRVDQPCALPQHFHKVLSVVTRDTGNVNCGARRCDTCRRCYRRDGETQVVELIK